MDQKAAYELTITEKLEQLTVPDVVDAIWARIEAQLDIDMPPGEGPAEPPATPKTGGGKWIGSIFIAALIAIIYFTSIRTSSNNNNDQPAVQEFPTINSAPGTENDKSPPAQTNTPAPIPANQNPGQSLLPLASGDSAAIIDSPAAPSTVVNDSAVNIPVVTAPPAVVPLRDTTKPKGRGVKGISDDDYRIVPTKKDSSE